MRRWGVLMLALAAPGCVGLDAWLKDKKPVEEPAPAVVAPRPRVLVSPGDVTERNARQMVEALREEIDRAETDYRPAPTAPVGGAKK